MGIPVLDYDATIAGEVQNPGLGPLHTEFDGRGYAYTSVYISSEIVKWSLETFEVVDRIDAYYSIGHLMLTHGDTRDPQPKYLVGLTKTARDRFLPVGPKQNHPAQLYDVSGDRMVLLKDFPTIGEPHYAQAIRADLISGNSMRIYELSENQHPQVTRRPGEARVEREGTHGARLHDEHPEPLHPRQHRGDRGGRHRLLPRDEPGAGLGRDPRHRHQGGHERRDHPGAGADQDPQVGPHPHRDLPLLLHRLLLGAPPGDAGLRPGVAPGIGGPISWRTGTRGSAN
jgi:hypothetical protein